jgi:threonine/homoserine/homoserine lactone efflux protein
VTGYPALLLAGFGLGVSVAAPIGPIGTLVIREGLERGTVPALLIGLGAATVDFIYLALVYAGIAPLLVRLPVLMTLCYTGGALLLGQMAWGALRRAWSGALPAPATGRQTRNNFLHGFGLTLLNPGTIVSWLGLGGAFAGAYLTRTSIPVAAGVLVAVFAGSAAWFLTLAGVTGGVGRLAAGRAWVFRMVNLLAGLALSTYTGFFLLKALGRA